MSDNPERAERTTFIVHVRCDNCATEYDKQFVYGTKLNTSEAWRGGLWDITRGDWPGQAVPVQCTYCGVAKLMPRTRTA